MKTNDEVTRLSKLEDKVRYVLREYASTRNDDIKLTIILWKTFYPGAFTYTGDLITDHLYLLPMQSEIIRIRAKIQNDQHEYVPTDEKIAKKRRWNISIWREYLGKDLKQRLPL